MDSFNQKSISQTKGPTSPDNLVWDELMVFVILIMITYESLNIKSNISSLKLKLKKKKIFIPFYLF